MFAKLALEQRILGKCNPRTTLASISAIFVG